MPTKTLNNIDFRVVGVFLRVNDVFNDAVDPPDGSEIEKVIKIPTLDVTYDGSAGPTVADVMAALQQELMKQGYVFMYNDIPGTNFLQTVTFGRADPSLPKYTLNSQTVDGAPSGGKTPGAAWQYYIFDTSESTPEKEVDIRVKVPHRNVYSQSPVIEDNYRIIWRLIVTYLRRDSQQMKAMEALTV